MDAKQENKTLMTCCDVLISFFKQYLHVSNLQREKHSLLSNDGTHGKSFMKPIIYFQTWRIGTIN